MRELTRSKIPRLQLPVKIANQLIIIIIIIFIYNICLLPGGSGYFTCKQNMKLVTTRFKSGGLHEKHVFGLSRTGCSGVGIAGGSKCLRMS